MEPARCESLPLDATQEKGYGLKYRPIESHYQYLLDNMKEIERLSVGIPTYHDFHLINRVMAIVLDDLTWQVVYDGTTEDTIRDARQWPRPIAFLPDNDPAF